MDVRKLVLALVKRTQEAGKPVETRKAEFKETYALRQVDGRINKAVQAELVRDVMALANALPDPENEVGVLIIGVSEAGEVVDDYAFPLNDIAELDPLINGVMERPIVFYYREYEIDSKKFGAIIIPRSSNTPHIVRNDLREDEKCYLRKGECWTRVEGGKRIAMAADYTDMYEHAKGMNKFQAEKTGRRVAASATRAKKKSAKKVSGLEQILVLDNEELDRQIKRLLK